MIKIDKSIPPPVAKTTKYPWAEMEVGDSFLIEAARSSATSLAGSASARYAPKRFVSRKEGSGRRIWRVV